MTAMVLILCTISVSLPVIICGLAGAFLFAVAEVSELSDHLPRSN